MKKILSLILVLSLVFVLSACRETLPDDDDDPIVTPSVPTLSGIQSLVTKTAGDEFDPLAGVTATDEIDGDITSDITVDGTDCLALVDGILTTGGKQCTLTYSVTNSNDLSAMKISTVTIQKGEAESGENMVVNGDFADDSQVDVWSKGEFEGGAATVSIVNEELKVEITSVAWSGPAFPRLHQSGMTYENGKTYKVSFEARADDARSLSSQVGVLLDSAPWFISYADAQTFELTTEMVEYSYEFTVTEADTTNGVLTLEMGYFADTDPEGGILTTVYFDNVVVAEVVEELGEEPVINGTIDETLEEVDAFDILEGVSAIDAKDGDLTDDITVVVAGPNGETAFDLAVEGVWNIDYSVTDSDGNSVTESRVITVVIPEEEPEDPEAPLPVVSNLVEVGTFEAATDLDAYGTLNDGDGTVTISIVDGMLKAEVVAGASAYQPRVDLMGIPFEQGKTYQVMFDAKSSVDGKKIQIQVGELLAAAPWFTLMGGPEVFTLGTEMDTYFFIFTMDIASNENGGLTFELGNITDSEGINADVFFDNIVVGEVTVDEPAVTGDNLVEVGTFDEATDLDAYGTLNDGDGTVTISIVEEMLKAEVVAGASAYQPRVDLMGIPFEQGKTYQVMFDAKSSVAKDITIQVGELLTAAPWFTDFMGAPQVFSLGTEMDTFFFTFTMDLDTNANGGLTFELGDVGDSIGVDADVYFDNIEVAEVLGEEPATGIDVAAVGDFDDAADLEAYTKYEADGGTATLTIEDGMLKIAVVSGTNAYTPRVELLGILFEEGKTYEVSFDAKSSVDGKKLQMQAGELLSADPWFLDFMGELQVFTLTTTVETYTFEFTMAQVTNANGGLTFELGNLTDSMDLDADVFLDNIVVTDVTPSGIDVAAVGDFDDAADLEAYTKYEADGGTATLTIEDGMLKIAVVSGTNAYTPRVELLGILFEEGKTYEVSFDAKSSVDGKKLQMQAGELLSADPWFLDFMGEMQVFTLTTTVETYTFEFTMAQVTNANGGLTFELGNLTDSMDLDADVFLDNIVVTEVVIPDPEWVAYGDGYSFTEDADVVTLTYTEVPANWWESNLQYENMVFDGVNNTVTVTLTGVDGQVYLFKIEGGGNEFEQEITADGTEQTLTLDLTGFTAEERAEFNKAIVFAKTSGQGGTLVFSYESTAEPEWVAYGDGYTFTEDAGTITLNYTAVPTNWWEGNIQYHNMVFDGLDNKVTFTLTGVDGQEYLFKIEGGGNFVEAGIMADGTEQTVTLDLTGLSPAERAEFNLLIVFAKSSGQAGTVDFSFETIAEPEWVAYGNGYSVTEDAGVVTLVYAGVPANWWESNLQYHNMVFDGANDQVVFTLTGVDGQDYLFKIEGGGNSTELAITADGTEQTLTLDLSAFTAAERDAFNLFVVFAKTADGAGTLVFSYEASISS